MRDWLAFLLMYGAAWLDRGVWTRRYTKEEYLSVVHRFGDDETVKWYNIIWHSHDGWRPERYV